MVNSARKEAERASLILKGAALAKRFLLIPQVMKILGVSRHTIYKLIAERKLTAIIEEQGQRTVFKFDPEAVEKAKPFVKADWEWKRGKGKIG